METFGLGQRDQSVLVLSWLSYLQNEISLDLWPRKNVAANYLERDMTHNVWNSPYLTSFGTKIHKKGRWRLCNPLSSPIFAWLIPNSKFSEINRLFFYNETFFKESSNSVSFFWKRQMSQDSLAKQTWHRSIFCTLRRSSPLKSIFSELFCYNKLLQLEPNRNTHTFLLRQTATKNPKLN